MSHSLLMGMYMDNYKCADLRKGELGKLSFSLAKTQVKYVTASSHVVNNETYGSGFGYCVMMLLFTLFQLALGKQL